MNLIDTRARAVAIGQEYGKVTHKTDSDDIYISLDDKGLRDSCETHLTRIGMDVTPFAMFSLRASLPQQRVPKESQV